MKKFHKLLLMSATAVVSIFGWSIHSIQAENSAEFKAIESIKDKTILIAQSQPSISDAVQFAVNAIHNLRQEGKINLRRDGNYTFGDIRVEIDNVRPELLNQNPSSRGNFNPFANWITIKNLKQDISVTVQVVGFDSYRSISYSTPKRVPGESINLCCRTYYPR